MLTEFHTYTFNVKLGIEVIYTSSLSTAMDLKSRYVIRVCYDYVQHSIIFDSSVSLILTLFTTRRTLQRILFKEPIFHLENRR